MAAQRRHTKRLPGFFNVHQDVVRKPCASGLALFAICDDFFFDHCLFSSFLSKLFCQRVGHGLVASQKQKIPELNLVQGFTISRQTFDHESSVIVSSSSGS